MANTTFSGPIRSENGVKLVSKNTTSGLISDRTVGDFPPLILFLGLINYTNCPSRQS